VADPADNKIKKTAGAVPTIELEPTHDFLVDLGRTKPSHQVLVGFAAETGDESATVLEMGAAKLARKGCDLLVVNDVSERAFQLERGSQWSKGKSAETFNPAGPWLVTPDEIDDVGNLRMWLDVSGERRQNGSTSTMIFDPYFIVHYLSQFLVLEPGDLINTGTPPGVGMGMQPQAWLQAGDVIELGIEGLGSQRQTVVPARSN
jgi:hypothetical protein